MTTDITRRGFLGGAAIGLVTAAAGFAGCAAPTQASTSSADAQSSVAESAATETMEGTVEGVMLETREGAGVVTLDNDQSNAYQAIFDVLVGGYFEASSSLCDGQVWGYNTSVQREAGQADETWENALAYLQAIGEGYEDDDMFRVFFDDSADLLDWLMDHGIEMPADRLNFSGQENDFADVATPMMHGHFFKNTTGRDATDALYAAASDLGVEFIWNARAERLITDPAGRVVGAVTQQGAFRGNCGVCITSGGFAHNTEFIDGFIPSIRGTSSNPHALGDGIKLGASVGARISNMWIARPQNPNTPVGEELWCNSPISGWGYPNIEVSLDAKRHYDEGCFYADKVERLKELDPQWAWSIFDDDSCQAWINVGATPHLSDKCESEVTAGWVWRADTIEDLARQIDLDPEALSATWTRYNEMCEAGLDEDFGRTKNLTKIATPPFYAVKIVPGCSDTSGGLKIGVDARVQNWAGDAIPGLYAAGAVTCGWSGKNYPGSGVAVTNAYLFGRIAGLNAAAEAPSTYTGKLADDAGAYLQADALEGVTLAANQYAGQGDGIGGPLVVRITVDDGKMTAVEIVEEHETEGVGSRAVDSMPDAILAAQSADIDTVSGATVTSDAIRTAVRQAMEEAGL